MQKRQERRTGGKNGSGAVFLAVLMFWGLLYPQFALTRDTYRAVPAEDGSLCPEGDSLKDYAELLTAEPGEIEIRFALPDEIEEWFGEKETYEQSGNESSDAHRSRGWAA